MARIDSFLQLVVDQGASDLHFRAGAPPVIRHDGDLVRLPFREISREEARRFLFDILTEDQRLDFQARKELDVLYDLKNCGRFRANLFEHHGGVGAVFRAIPLTVPSMDELALPQVLKRLIGAQNGLILVCGPTGSGKTTTMAALIHEINRTTPRHVITIEDPVEYVHEDKLGVVTQRQVGLHARTFSSALRSALREAPDVMMLGEMRDLETMTLALSAAETGILVLGTLHTNSATGAIDRIIDTMPSEAREQVRGVLSVLLRGVVSQRLVKRANGQGRIAAIEVLLQSHAVSHMIRDNKMHMLEGELQSAAEGSGSQSLDRALFALTRERVIEPDAAIDMARFPEQLRQRFAALPSED